MEEITRLIAVRHGETAWNVDTRIQGQLDIGLNATGLWQAKRVGQALADEDIGVIYASDLSRAWQTAQEIAKPHGLTVLPECWCWHPDVIEELLWLMHAWCAAYQGKSASVALAGDWHDRQRPGVVARLRKSVGSCSIETHQTRPGWNTPPGGPVTVPGVEHTELIVSWWAGARDSAPPEPTAPAGPVGGDRS